MHGTSNVQVHYRSCLAVTMSSWVNDMAMADVVIMIRLRDPNADQGPRQSARLLNSLKRITCIRPSIHPSIHPAKT